MEYKAKKHYQDRKVADGYDEARFNNIKGAIADWAEKRLVERAIGVTAVRPPAKILDIPCGTGRLTAFLARRGFNIHGADISKEMIQEAEKKLSKYINNRQVTLFQADAEELTLSSRNFALAISLRLFGHIPPEVRIQILGELKKVSRHVIAVYSLKGSFQEIARRKRRALAGIMWFPATIREINSELDRAGLKKIKILHLLRGISESVAVIADSNLA